MPSPDLVKRLAELVDGDGWHVADLLVEEFPVDRFGDGGSKANNELYAELEACEDQLRKDYGIELKVSTLRQSRSTALAWQHDQRVSSAPFIVHKAIRGEDRFDRMARYLKRNKGRALSSRVVARFRADDNPKPPVPWDIATRKSFESTARRVLLAGAKVERTDWWNAPQVDEDARSTVVDALRDLAKRLGG